MRNLNFWNDGKVKEEILSFVKKVTTPNSPDYIPPESRIAVFDNDGTLWCEKPMQIQADFLFRKMGEMVKEDPSLGTREPFKSLVAKDFSWLAGAIDKHYEGDDSDLKIMAKGILESYEGFTVEEFATKAHLFLQEAKHPKLNRPYLECTYRPMIELLRFLEMNDFTNYIASGGGRDFIRTVTDDLYHIPPERIIGSSVSLAYEEEGKYVNIIHKFGLDIFDDGPDKPVRIWNRIGRRPVLCVGNSNGDIPMLRFCAHPSRPSLSILIHHDDEKREFFYEKGAETALQKAREFGWCVVSMKDDWKEVFSQTSIFQEKAA